MLRKMISCLLIIALMLTVGKVSIIIPVGAIDADKTEAKVLDTATMEDDFTDDCVMVILTNTESLKFRSYTASDFPEVACKSVEDLSSASAARVQAKLRGDEMETRDAGAAFMNRNVNVDTFRTILCLKLETPGKGNVLKAIRALEQREDVYYAGPNYIITLDLPVSASSDTSRSTASTNDLTDNIGWGEDAIELSYAWQKETGDSAIKVGVLDSGIDVTHPDLQGRVSTSLSRDFAPDNVSPTTDWFGHGTHVAGIIGGTGNNTLGIRGVCQNVTLVSLRVLYPDLEGDDYTTAAIVAEAIDYAEENNIPILNLSLSADSWDGQSALLDALNNYSGLVVCSAGNKGLNNVVSNPAMAEYDNIISVGASAQGNVRASFSNYGNRYVDLFAPGDGIASCFPEDLCAVSGCTGIGQHIAYGYHYMDGTSMAAPYVTGVAALLLSSHRQLNALEIKDLILNNTKSYAAFSNLCVTGGLLNAKNAFNDATIHNRFIDYQPAGASRHRVYCTGCSFYSSYYEPHAYDGTGICLLCNYH